MASSRFLILTLKNFIVTNAHMKQQRHINFLSVKTVHGSTKRVWKKRTKDLYPLNSEKTPVQHMDFK